jgi:hypothetical protein
MQKDVIFIVRAWVLAFPVRNGLVAASRRCPNNDVAFRKAPRNCESASAAFAFSSNVSLVTWFMSINVRYALACRFES